MNTKHDPSAPSACLTCDFEPFVKNNYFTGKMMGASEFVAETHYHQEKLRLHQVRLHGWGVVCGLAVLQHPSIACRPRYVVVEPGSAVDCCGHDILVPEEEMLDLLSFPAVAALAKEAPAKLHVLGICIRFVECPTETVPVLYDDCGCDDDGCAPNRILESYALDVVLDPPLAWRRRQLLAGLAGAMFARSPDPGLGAATPRVGLAPVVVPAAGDATLYALDAGKPSQVIALDLSTQHAARIDLGAIAYALAGRGDFAFIATAPKAAGLKPLVQILAPGANATPAPVEVTGAAAASTLALSASTDANRAAIVYERETGNLFAFAADAALGLKAPTPLGAVTANLSGFIAKPDGTVAYAINAAGKVQVITLRVASTIAPLGLLPAGATAAGLAYFASGAQSWLAIASRIDRALYIFDLANAAVLATLALDHPAEAVSVVAPGTAYVIEEEGGAQYLQMIDLAPLAAAQSAVIAAPRLIGGTGLRVIGLETDATAAILAAATRAGEVCDELLWRQLEHCPGCEQPNCVTLATVERYQAGASLLDADPTATLAADLAAHQARIDNRESRHVLASTATLQAWLECLAAQGGQGAKGDPGPAGAPGAPGIGLYPNLPKILDIGWSFEQRINLTRFYNIYASLTSAQIVNLVQAGGAGVPPLTVYFNKPMKGVSRRTFSVAIDVPLAAQDAKTQQYVSSGIYLPIELRLYGTLVEVQGALPTPHTGEQAPYAVSFLPAPELFLNGQGQVGWPLLLLYYAAYAAALAKLDPPRALVSLRGDFMFAPDAGNNYTELGVLDAANIGGRVGFPPPATRLPPIQGGKNPSGNLTQGGLFESWFFLEVAETNIKPIEGALRQAPLFSPVGSMFLGMPQLPATANFSSAEEIAATGVPAALANRLVAERKRQPFEGVADLRKRLGLSDRDWAALSQKLVVL
jgi:hypothetical protein